MKLIVNSVIVGNMDKAVIRHPSGKASPGYSMTYGEVEITVCEDEEPIAADADALWFGDILVERQDDGSYDVGDPEIDQDPEHYESFAEACHRASVRNSGGSQAVLN